MLCIWLASRDTQMKTGFGIKTCSKINKIFTFNYGCNTAYDEILRTVYYFCCCFLYSKREKNPNDWISIYSIKIISYYNQHIDTVKFALVNKKNSKQFKRKQNANVDDSSILFTQYFYYTVNKQHGTFSRISKFYCNHFVPYIKKDF